MKLHVLSDLHLECRSLQLEAAACDAVVLAGDTHQGLRGVAWAESTFPQQPVLYVAGNHEFYGQTLPGLIGQLKERTRDSDIHVLENDEWSMLGYRFFGCTLWTDMALLGDAAPHEVRAQEANDYRQIRGEDGGALSPVKVQRQHQLSLSALTSFLEAGDPQRSIVITHHAPSPHSIPAAYRGHRLSPSYASNLDALILRTRPLLWIHGHIHVSQRYRLGATTVLANPRGYYNQLAQSFHPGLIVDLDELRRERKGT